MKRLLMLLAHATCAVCLAEPMRVTLTFDDNLKDHLTIAAPELEARGWRGTFNIVSDRVGQKDNALTWDEVRELARRGHELTTHGKTHCHMVKLLAEKGEAAVRGELSVSRDAIADNTGFAPRYYCSPFIEQDTNTARLARLEGLEQFSIPRHNFGEGNAAGVRAFLLRQVKQGAKRVDVLHHGVCSKACGGCGGWRPFKDRAEFAAHLDAIASLEREGKIVVTDYDGAVSDCALKAKAWPRHGVIALSFDDHHVADWDKTLPVFAKYGARTTFFLDKAVGEKEIAFARKAMLAGHEIGLHGFRHRNADEYLAKHGEEKYWKDEVNPQLSAFAKAGIRPRSFAYPNSRRNRQTDEVFFRHGFTRVRGRGKDAPPNPNPYDPKGEKRDRWRPVAAADADFWPAADYLTTNRVLCIVMGEAYYTDIDDIVAAMRRAGERGEMLSLVSHGIRPKATDIHMKAEWLERMLAEANAAGVIVRGVR